MKTIFDFAAKRAELSPDALAFHQFETEVKVSFAEFNRRAEQGASVLQNSGLDTGDRLAVLCHNTSVFFELLFACGKIGAILVPLNWRQTPTELTPILIDCGARMLLHDASTAPLAHALAASTGVRLTSFADFDDLLGKVRPVPRRDTAWPTDRIWYLLYTSGTTGRPKAVIQTVGMALANALNVQQATQLTSADRTLNFLPLFHTAGINLHTLPLFIAGGSSTVLAKFEVEPLLDLVAADRISIFFGVPAVYQALSLNPGFAAADLSRVRHWGCGGAPLPASLIHLYLAKGVRVCNGMGMTETGPTVFLMNPERAAEKIGSVGKPQLLSEVRLIDASGRDVEDGERGEILFRGPNITPGYYNDPEATAAAITPDGWLRSGDIARRDSEGYYYIVDRIKDMFISGGENVYPAEVEGVLCNHPAVLEAAVIGVADARWGEVGHAAVRLREAQTLEAAELTAFARRQLAAYKVPKYVTVLEDFPRTAAGKVQKHLLRRRLGENG
ncbi:MAG TPA: long-chain fatty acid--CoA ligase [Hyphomicrobiaceae bacterium]|jgi:fatty-acyl-CoA synthase|nr:long-chain fatty acid--CoA ligase [Hyphomicrobiaceae bacterium]